MRRLSFLAFVALSLVSSTFGAQQADRADRADLINRADVNVTESHAASNRTEHAEMTVDESRERSNANLAEDDMEIDMIDEFEVEGHHGGRGYGGGY